MSWKSVNSFRLFGIFAIRERQRPRWLRSPCLRAKEDFGVPERAPFLGCKGGVAAKIGRRRRAIPTLENERATARERGEAAVSLFVACFMAVISYSTQAPF